MMFLVANNVADPFCGLVGAAWLEDITFASVAVRIVFAVIFGCILGAERAMKHQAAGFRTYTLVCLGATIAMMTGQFLMKKTDTGDSARLGAQVISGIGFLGAGTILITSRNQIRGLTTAAGLWSCACLGLAIGAGFYTLAVFALIAILFILTVLPICERAIIKRSRSFGIHIEFECRANLKEFVNFVRSIDVQVLSTDHNTAYASSGLSVYTISIWLPDKVIDHKKYLDLFQSLPYVNHVEETK